MPVYVYKNLQTGETFELEQRITEAALTAHPQTGEPVKRIIQPVGIAFKGSGFYVTDSRGSTKSPAKNDSGSTSEVKSDSASKGESSSKKDSSSD
jgi:putative FmdB family regulatory protein